MLGQVRLTLVRGQEWVWMWGEVCLRVKAQGRLAATLSKEHTRRHSGHLNRGNFSTGAGHQRNKTTCLIKHQELPTFSRKFTFQNQDIFSECEMQNLKCKTRFDYSNCNGNQLKMPRIYWPKKYMALGRTLQYLRQYLNKERTRIWNGGKNNVH